MVELSNYRILLQELHSDLLDEDVKCIKFLAQPLIQKRLYEGIEDGLGLLNALEDCGMLSFQKLSFLMELCETVGRRDLFERIQEEKVVCMDAVVGKEPMVCPFRRLLYNLYREIPDNDLSRMRFLYGRIPKRATVNDPVDFFGFMLRDRTLSPDNFSELKSIFTEISRQDLIEEILNFENTVRPENCNYSHFKKHIAIPVQQETPMDSSEYSSSSSNGPNLESGMSYQESYHQVVFQEPSMEDGSGLSTGQSSYSSYTHPGIDDLQSATFVSSSMPAGIYSTVETEPPQSSPAATDSMIKAHNKMRASASNCYKMTADPRGLCIIIDVQTFRRENFRYRYGSEYDRDNLRKTFERLKFTVREKVNATAAEIRGFLQSIARGDHTAFDCIVFCILSHGGINYFYGSDGEKVFEDPMFALFSAKACPSLANKPKLFFFSYCRGQQEQEGVHVIDTDGPGTTDLSDFLYAYATPQNYVSYRHRSKGTFYIQVLTQVLNEEAESMELQHILLKVNHEVSRMDTGTGKRQIPEPKHTLQKQLYFV